MKKAVVLNSRQGLRPLGSDSWLTNTEKAVKEIISENHTLLASVGMSSWEATLYFASKYGARQEVIIPIAAGQNRQDIINYYTRQFQLDSELVKYNFIELGDIKKDFHAFQTNRDQIAVDEADLIYPVSIRPRGNLFSLIDVVEKGSTIIDNKYGVEYQKGRNCKIELDEDRLNPEIDCDLENHVIHWTRSVNSPWPGEMIYDYYDAIMESGKHYPRSAIDTLIRILTEKKLRASSRHYRKGIKAVAFSELEPSEAVNLMKWRARYHEMAFEPYGFAINKNLAGEISIQKAIYGKPEIYNKLPLDNRPYFQPFGKIGNWAPEREYRHIGDIDLLLIPIMDMKVIVWNRNEISEVKKIFSGEIISLYR